MLWVAMDFNDGVSIRELLCSGLPEPCIRYATAAAVAALECVHSWGACHRYVKSSNYLLDLAGVVRLGDFGVAEQLSTLTRKKAKIGTPFWMAPEVVTGPKSGSGATADMWAVGITAIEMAEVIPPRGATHSPATVLEAIVELAAPTFSLAEPSRQLRDFVARCLTKVGGLRRSTLLVSPACG